MIGGEIEKTDVESIILRKFINIDTKRPKAYSQASQWALTLAELNQDEKAFKKIQKESNDIYMGLDIHTLEELCNQFYSNSFIQIEMPDGKERKIRLWELYSKMDEFYTKILRVISIMYQEGEFTDSFMMKDYTSSEDDEEEGDIPVQNDYRGVKL